MTDAMTNSCFTADIMEMRTAIDAAVDSVLATAHFRDMSRRNWYNDQGNEEEIYPYFTEALRRSFDIVEGIGPGKLKNRPEKVDCLVLVSSRIYAVELKGPSKDKAYINEGISRDFNKLLALLKSESIVYGVAIGILLEKTTLECEYAKVFMVGEDSIGVKVIIKETQ